MQEDKNTVSAQNLDQNARAEDIAWRSEHAKLVGNDPLFTGAAFGIPLPMPSLRESSSVADLGLWYAIGEAWVHVALSQVRNAEPRVLDIGCGCGKMARFFAINPRTSYLGIDVFKPSVEWSKQAFESFPNFRFKHFDVHSPLYNGNGVLDVNTARVPAKSQSADLIICASLFTHLLESAFCHYLHEIKRCLSSNGVAIVSTHNAPPNGLRFSGKETRIDITDDYFDELVTRAGLRSFKLGTVFGQEVFNLRHL
jgi:SAM-dependent methyltransferase